MALLLALGATYVLAEPASADPTCPTDYSLDTTDVAASLDFSASAIDANANGYLCRLDILNDDGMVDVLFVDDTDPVTTSDPACPDDFVLKEDSVFPTPGFSPADRNGNGFVCVKSLPIESGRRLIVIDDPIGL
jgi:hypothetical protein